MQLPYTLSENPALNEFDPLALEDEGPAWFEKTHADDAAYDLRAKSDGLVAAGDIAFVPTGIRLAIPEGYAGLVLPRSGLAFESGITVANSPGLIDPGYRGEVAVLLHNTRPPFVLSEYDDDPIPRPNEFGTFRYSAGDRIAQLLFVKTADLTPLYVAKSDFDWHTERGEGGFGSTGR